MKTAFTLLFISLFILFTGCSKGPDLIPISDEEQLAKYLTGDGNRVWHLTAVYQNDLLQTLTAAQLQYTKTFTLTPGHKLEGTFTDNDIKGIWDIQTRTLFHLSFYSAAGVPVDLDCYIKSVSDSKLDFYYNKNNIRIEEVYYAY
jgi:hypothetical protein